MTVSRAAIRREAAARLGSLAIPYPLTAASGSTTTTVVSELIDASESDYKYIGSRAIFISGTAGNIGEERTVTSYLASSGTLTFNRTLPSAITAADTFELHDWLDPRIWNDCISRGLRRCQREHSDQLTIVDNTLNYSLAALTALVRPAQVYRVKLRLGATAGQYIYRELTRNQWDISIDDDVLTLDLTSGFTNQTTQTLWIDWTGPYADLATDAATTTCDMDWIVSATIKYAFEIYGELVDAQSKAGLRITQAANEQEFKRFTRMFSPKHSTAVRLPWTG